MYIRSIITLSTLLCTLTCLSCSGSRTTISHPGYSMIPKEESVALFPLKHTLIVHSQKSIAQQLNIQREYLHANLVSQLDSVITHTVTAAIAHPVEQIPDSAQALLLPNESFNLYGNTYVKGAWPAQGTAIQSTSKTTPHFILFLHEVNIGLGLTGPTLYDYTLSNKELEEVSEDLSIVITWSLWDNTKQQFTTIGYEESTRSSNEFAVTIGSIKSLLKETLSAIIQRTPLTLAEEH